MLKSFTIPLLPMSERLDQALAKLMPEYSRTQIQKWIAAGIVQVNGQIAKSNLRLMGYEEVTVDIPPSISLKDKPQAIDLNIVYEDEAVLVINKPAGLVVHPGAGNPDSTLLNALLHHEPSLSELPRAGILHRLDKDTSGLLLIAKTADALKKLSYQLKKRTLLREYQGIVYGTFISGGLVDAPIARHRLKRKHMAVSDEGKEARTHYRIMEKYRAHTRLKMRLETGRTHQIRVHMAHIHKPIVGDPIYGGRIQLAKQSSPELIQALRQFKRQALHAYLIGFIHPVTSEPMQFEIALPDDMLTLIHVLKEDAMRKTK